MANYDRGGLPPRLVYLLPIEGAPPLSNSLHTILFSFLPLMIVFVIVFVIVSILYSIVLNFFKSCNLLV